MRFNRGTNFPGAMALGATRDPGLAIEAGRITAEEARALGIMQNFAPVADVNTNPLNPVINTRSFGDEPGLVSAMVAASTAPNVDGLVINVGSGIETSLRDLVKDVLDVTGGQPEVIYNSQTSGGVSRMAADLMIAQDKLNYHPSIKLEDGLRLTLQRDSRFK